MRSRPRTGPGLLADLVHEAATVTQLPATGTDGRAQVRTGPLANVNDRDWSNWATGGPNGGDRR